MRLILGAKFSDDLQNILKSQGKTSSYVLTFWEKLDPQHPSTLSIILPFKIDADLPITSRAITHGAAITTSRTNIQSSKNEIKGIVVSTWFVVLAPEMKLHFSNFESRTQYCLE